MGRRASMAAVDTVSLTIESVGVSLVAPRGWRAEPFEHGVRLFGPADERVGGARPTWSITEVVPDGYGTEWFERFTGGAADTLRTSFTRCVIDREERFELSSLVAVHAVHYHWTGEDGTVTHQVQATLSRSRQQAYVVHAATRGPDATADLVAVRAILRSLRFLPPRS